MTSTTKIKAVKYDLPRIEDMVPNIWSPIKVAYDKYTLWGISHWREQRKSFYAFARGMQSRGDMYLTKRILEVTHVSVMMKHGYGYLEEIVVRRADNALYRFKEEHAEFDESDTYVLERFDTSAGNHVKEILLKLNLPDHRIFKDGGKVLKLKKFKKDAVLKLIKIIKSRKIMPPRMRTRSAGRPVAESRGRRMGERIGKGGRGRRPREGSQWECRGSQWGYRRSARLLDDHCLAIAEPLTCHASSVNGNRVGYSYKEFLACNPKEYDGKGGVVVLTRWIEKMENVQDMTGCSVDQKVKYNVGSFVGKVLTWWNSQIRMLSREVIVSMSWNDFKFMILEEFCPSHEMQKLETEFWNHAMVEASHAAYTNRFHELASLVPHLVTPESMKIERYVYGLALQIRRMMAAMKPKTIQKTVQISGALTDEAVRNGSIKKVEKKGNAGETSKDKNVRDDNKVTRTGNALLLPQTLGPCRTCFNYNCPGHLVKDCRGVPRNVNPVNARNPIVKGQGSRNQGNQARDRAFMLGAEEAR
ncbi:reverse transcriptase domain-containing protein [Tanacetum coccineum]